MRALRCNAHGALDTLVICDVADPVPGRGEVVVDVAAAAANFPDVLIVADRYQVHVPVPFTPGSEYAGTVSSLGPGVEGFSVGDRVMGALLVGAFAEKVLAPAASVRSVDAVVDPRSAAAFGVAYRTAYAALKTVAHTRAGEFVVVLGAAGGVGLAAVELARVLGARVIAAASSPEKLAVCAAKGAEEVIDYGRENLKERLKAITGRGADVVIDPVGGPSAEQALRAMRWGGRFVSVGFASGEIPEIPLNLVLLKGAIVTGFTIEGLSRNEPDAMARDGEELWDLLVSGRIAPHVGAVFPLDDAARALAELAERRAVGKILVEPTPAAP